MMVFTIALTVGFGSSDRLAGAYGTAVSTTMVLTTALLYRVMRDRGHWPVYQAGAVTVVLLAFDLAFFPPKLLKISGAGSVPLTFRRLGFFSSPPSHSAPYPPPPPHPTNPPPPTL